VVVSGTPIQRPIGQFYDKTAPVAAGEVPPVVCGPSRQMDYELEFAAIVGKPLGMNKGLNAKEADEHIFGFVILNDWSGKLTVHLSVIGICVDAFPARDIQGFEMRPLGPCNGKNLGTTISPWIVTIEALEPFKVQLPAREVPVASYLEDPDQSLYSIDMTVEIISSGQATLVGKSSLSSLYWNIRQMVAHTVSAGSALRTGDLLATGTVSGTGPGSYGCLLESTEGGKNPISLNDGTERRFLNDGDVVQMVAVAGEDGSGVGFGDCFGELIPARNL
jgi:fumarylacetoacetase